MGRGSSETTRSVAFLDRLSRPPGDVVFVLSFTGLSTAGVFLLPDGSPARVLVGLPLLFFLPGYALLAVLFPGGHGESGPRARVRWNRTNVTSHERVTFPHQAVLSVPERLALSVGFSIVVVPLLGLGIVVSPVAVTTPVLATILAAVVVLGMAHRWWRPPASRYRDPIGDAVTVSRAAVFGPSSRRAQAVNLVVLVVTVAALATLTAALVAPPQSETYTDVSLLSEDDSGEYVSGGYPDELAPGESAELVLALENEEGERTAYSVVVVLERVEGDGHAASAATVEELTRFEVTVEDGGSASVEHEIAPTTTGEELRVNYLVYRGDPPDDPDTETAYRHVHIWIDVVGEE